MNTKIHRYGKARKKPSIQTGLDINIFPIDIPFTLEEILDTEYLPN